MNRLTAQVVTGKQVAILEEYERVKAGQGSLFTTANELCQAHHVVRVDRKCIFHLSLGRTFRSLLNELSSFHYRYNFERQDGGLNYIAP